MSIFENNLHVDSRYDKFEKFVSIMYRGLWTPAKYEKLIREVDVPYIENRMNLTDSSCIKNCILAVILVEDKVKLYWPTIYNDFPQTIIGDVGGLFGQSEVTHRRSYFSLANQLGLSVNDIDKYPALKGRVAYLTKHLQKDPKVTGEKRKLKKIVLFSSLVERCSLFTQFYILMSYAKRNRGLKTISALQESTAIEEDVHYHFGLEIINTVKQEKPHLWSEYLVDLIEKNIEDAYKAELELIDWFFQEGVPEHLTKEEVVNFLNYNFNQVSKDLGLGISYKVDEELFEEKNAWFKHKVFMTTEPDFFDSAVSGYASDDEEVDVNSVFN
jgi:ribonucleotide reductase beta subunit family protein with ferritin-like domain